MKPFIREAPPTRLQHIGHQPMHLRAVHITNLKTLRNLTWALPEEMSSVGWHVILGDNAAGKSTFMQAIAMGLLGGNSMAGLRKDTAQYVSHGEQEGVVFLRVLIEPQFDETEHTQRDVYRKSVLSIYNHNQEVQPDITVSRSRSGDFDYQHTKSPIKGWFSASFGPMRRFSGGNKEHEKIFQDLPRLAAHLSIFGEDVALTEVERWLSKLRLQQLEQGSPEGHFLDVLKRFINQPGLMPHGAKWEEVNSEGVFFRDGHGHRIQIEALSDGFRSILCLAFELIRQLEVIYGEVPLEEQNGQVVVKFPGVVLIDEIDAHLHPTWQQEVGFWFTRFFPHIQFIVSTHSPLICRAAEKGTIFKLPSPAEPEADAGFVTGEARLRLLRGDVQSAYSTRAFGDISVSPTAQKLSNELASLSAIEHQRELQPEEKLRVDELKQQLPLPEIDSAQQHSIEIFQQLLKSHKG